jgi:hypothetical protein
MFEKLVSIVAPVFICAALGFVTLPFLIGALL